MKTRHIDDVIADAEALAADARRNPYLLFDLDVDTDVRRVARALFQAFVDGRDNERQRIAAAA